jgi:hypothetical protein
MENKNTQTEIVVILDRSGSMRSIGKSTVDGFNTFLDEQQNSEGEAFLTLVQFDDRYEIDYKSSPIREVAPLILNETFVPRGNTALFDAVGKTIEELETDRDVILVIITDGHENSSNTYKREAIMKMIETKEKDGWKVLFLAANQDAIAAGASIGVHSSKSMTWGTDSVSVLNTYANFSSNIASYRSAKLNSLDPNDETLKDVLSFSQEQREESKKS